MNISAFLTQQIATGNGKGGVVPGQALSNGTGIFSGAAGLNFMDLIFARLTAASNTDIEKHDKGDATANQLLLKTPEASALKIGTVRNTDFIGVTPHESTSEPLGIEQILQALTETDGAVLEDIFTPEELAALKMQFLSPENITKNIQGTASTPTTTLDKPSLEKATASAGKKLQGIITALLAGTPQENGEAVFKIDIHERNGQESSPALIATGLSPEKLTAILKDITNGNEQGEAFILGLVNILPPESRKEAIFLPRGIVITQPQHPAGDISTPQTATNGTQQQSDLATKLNALTTGADGQDLPAESNDFEDVLRILEKAQGSDKYGLPDNPNKGIETAIRQVREHIGASLSSIQGTPPLPGEVSSGFVLNDIFPEGCDFTTGSSHSLNLTGPAQLTSMISHIQQAGMPHPATQMIASVIAKNTTNGESKNITIQLDPPELGRVSIRMEFNKDSHTMKALLVAEKPETFLMLQRDAHILERALQDAGIDADGGLSFEMSQDGNMFEQDEHSTGGYSGGGGLSNETDDAPIEIITAKMDWYVDPETGLTRYDALV